MSADAETIARELGGARRTNGAWLCRCPVPSHGKGRGDKSPSLRVADGDVAPLLTCFAGCDRHDIAAELQARGLLDGGRSTAGSPRRQSGAGNPAYEVNPDPRALEIWRGAEPIGGSGAVFDGASGHSDSPFSQSSLCALASLSDKRAALASNGGGDPGARPTSGRYSCHVAEHHCRTKGTVIRSSQDVRLDRQRRDPLWHRHRRYWDRRGC